MLVYIDNDFKCHVDNDGTRKAIETTIFDGKCKEYVEGYMFIPDGCEWTREDGMKFYGEMAIPHRMYNELSEIQAAVDRATESLRIIEKVGITIEKKPADFPDRPGYEWTPVQKIAGGSITWVESGYMPSLLGTNENPIPFEEGTEVRPNYYYILDDVRKVWFGAKGAHPKWDDEDFIEF